jgi:hypothetical protein
MAVAAVALVTMAVAALGAWRGRSKAAAAWGKGTRGGGIGIGFGTGSTGTDWYGCEWWLHFPTVVLVAAGVTLRGAAKDGEDTKSDGDGGRGECEGEGGGSLGDHTQHWMSYHQDQDTKGEGGKGTIAGACCTTVSHVGSSTTSAASVWNKWWERAAVVVPVLQR